MGLSKLGAIQSESYLDRHWMDILNATTSGECVIDAKGVVRFVNRTFCQDFQLSQASLIGQRLWDFIQDTLVMKSLRHQRSGEGFVNYRQNRFKVKTMPIQSLEGFQGLRVTYDFCSKVEHIHPIKLGNTTNPYPQIIGQNPRLLKALSLSKKIASKHVTVMLRGESGTGKGLLAKTIHEDSPRCHGPFIAINCAAIPETLIESELFGYEAGAFTGAMKTSIGQFERADGGTLFLDEIGDLSYSLQVKLLRVLEDKTIRRIGGQKDIPVDVRIITATHHNLEGMIRDQCFREDLYYRLHVIEIELPPLRERLDDLKLLSHELIRSMSRHHGMEIKALSDEAFKAMVNYPWDGNIRELANVLERAILLSETPKLELHDLPDHISKEYAFVRQESNGQLINLKSDGNMASLEAYEGEIIAMAVERFGSFSAAGRALGVTHKTVAAKFRKQVKDR